MGLTRPKHGRHHPRTRMIQYSVTPVLHRKVAAYWIPAFAGMTADFVAAFVSNYTATKNSFNALAVASGFSSVRK
jgi:hypothetical protein